MIKTNEIVDNNRNGIILIDVQVPGEGTQVKISIKGTGFIISPDGIFITNAHVWRQIQESEMDFAGVSVPGTTDGKGLTHYDRFKIEKIAIDDDNDIALLKIISDKTFATVSQMETTETMKEGDDVVFIGYPLAVELLNMGFGITMTTNKCIVSSLKRRGGDGSLHFFLVDTHINGGSSGSPVFSAETGKIVGISSARISSKIQIPGGPIADIPANLGICRPIKYAIDLISKSN